MRPPRTKPRIWPWLLGALLVFLALVGGCGVVVASRARAPVAATNRFVAALDEGRTADAYALLCAETQASVDPATFAADHTAAPDITGYTFLSMSATTGQLTQVSGAVEIADSPRTVSYGLQRENGEWRICSYEPLQ